MSTPTSVRWRSKFTGNVNVTPLGSEEFATNYVAALRRSGHSILSDDGESEVTSEQIERIKGGVTRAKAGETVELTPGLLDALDGVQEQITDEIYADRLTPEAREIVDAHEARSQADGLEELTITQLRKINGAEKLGIVGSWELKKPALIEAIRIARAAK